MKRRADLHTVKDMHAVRSVEVVNLLHRMYAAGGFMAKSLSPRRDRYGPLIKRKVQPFLSRLYSGGRRSFSSRELCRELGEVLDSNDSLLCAASRKNVPVFVPGIMDGAVGSQLWLFAQQHRDFRIDVIQDQNDLSDLVYGSKRTGAVIIGGGISKHHVLWNLFKG